MRSILYYAESCVDSWYDHEANAIIAKWFDLTTKIHMIKAIEIHLETIEKYKPVAAICDFGEARGIPYPEVHEWVKNTLFTEAQKRGIRYVINILPKNPIARIGIKNWQDLGQECHFNMLDASSVEEALEYVKRVNLKEPTY